MSFSDTNLFNIQGDNLDLNQTAKFCRITQNDNSVQPK